MTVALITTNPYAILATFAAAPAVIRLPRGDTVEGAQVGWSGEGCALVAVTPFSPPPGQQITGSPSYSIDGSGNVTESYAIEAIPPAPITTMQLVSTSTSALNGSYSIDQQTQQNVAAVAEYIAINGKFPDGMTAFPMPDASGTPHSFPTIVLFQAFATAMANFVTALDLGQTPAQPVTIA